MELFNKEKQYDEEISPLVKKVIAECRKHGIPMIASFAYENCEDRGVGICTTLVNSIEGRKVDKFQRAARIIKSVEHSTFAIASTAKQD